jgi:hypothetical protein
MERAVRGRGLLGALGPHPRTGEGEAEFLKQRTAVFMGTKLRTFLRTVVLWYFYCGLVLGFIVWFSYMWGLHSNVPAEVPTDERLRATLRIQPMVALDTGTRVVGWGPSLAIWATTPNGYSFGKWLAPGFYAKRLSPAV